VKHKGIGAAALGAVVALGGPAWAKDMVYSPLVHDGEKEIEYYVDWHEDTSATDVVGHELAFEWGATARDQLALYGVWEDLSGRDLEMTEYQLEWIHQFFEQGEHAWDVGTYLEYATTDTGDAAGVEAKILLEKTLPRTTVTLNGIIEKPWVAWKEASPEVGYAVRWALRLGPRVTPAVEWFGDLGEIEDLKDGPETTQLLGPVVDVRLTRAIKWHVGTLFGLTRDSENVRVKTQLAVEWY